MNLAICRELVAVAQATKDSDSLDPRHRRKMPVQQIAPHTPTTSNPRQSLALLWTPCIVTLLYLGGSLLLFKFGPVDWPVRNEGELWAFNALYLSMFLGGYAAALHQRHRWTADGSGTSSRDFAARFFWPVWLCAALVVLIGHRNLTLGPSYLPTTLFSDFVDGLVDPLGAYLYKLSDEAKGNFAGNPALTLLFGVLAFSKLVLVHMLVAGWPALSRLKKLLGCLVALFPIASGVCVGTNKPVFDVAFMFAAILAANVFMAPSGARLAFIGSRRALIALTAGVFVFAGAYFQHTMNARAPGLGYAESLSSTAGAVRLKPGFQSYCENADEWTAKGCHLASIGSIYLTQGYYGMSLSLDIPHETTYGLGHSKFILDTLKKYLGIDLAPRTFQHKIHGQWSATGQWHSAYSQWANDVGFAGVGLVMLTLGFYACAIWISALATHNAAAVCSIPLLATLIIFIPANNQVFNLFESLATFIVLFLAWVASLAIRPRARLRAS
ncbi:MAG: hypothetical protein IBJ04_15600 [Hydrogenophaga sp.]|uniref:hypothetical protein n=1 Tax=Hydrogenophaga sp. TaxID=1904254 RepID=UPI00257DFBF4|nr:hypothetical protein [Hydrogenophaga sp.]MBL0945741.1 hypothetical protein [Hydrogenophaga sp.]